MSSSAFTAAERIVSIKAAILGGFCAGLISLTILGVHRALTMETVFPLSGGLFNMSNLTLLVNGAIAALSGALFALTYRYAIRNDKNIQLNAGVVLAFSLVRGLALVDAGSAIAQHFWPFFAACGESFLMFGLTAVVITVATNRQWLSPFG